jgi:hypothetical protein
MIVILESYTYKIAILIDKYKNSNNMSKSNSMEGSGKEEASTTINDDDNLNKELNSTMMVIVTIVIVIIAIIAIAVVIDEYKNSNNMSNSNSLKGSGEEKASTAIDDKMNSHSNRNCLCCLKEVKGQSRCSKCRTALYCSRKCQLKHWPVHKNTCIDSNTENNDVRLGVKATNYCQQGI